MKLFTNDSLDSIKIFLKGKGKSIVEENFKKIPIPFQCQFIFPLRSIFAPHDFRIENKFSQALSVGPFSLEVKKETLLRSSDDHIIHGSENAVVLHEGKNLIEISTSIAGEKTETGYVSHQTIDSSFSPELLSLIKSLSLGTIAVPEALQKTIESFGLNITVTSTYGQKVGIDNLYSLPALLSGQSFMGTPEEQMIEFKYSILGKTLPITLALSMDKTKKTNIDFLPYAAKGKISVPVESIEKLLEKLDTIFSIPNLSLSKMFWNSIQATHLQRESIPGNGDLLFLTFAYDKEKVFLNGVPFQKLQNGNVIQKPALPLLSALPAQDEEEEAKE